MPVIIYDTITDVPEALRSQAKEENGKYVLDADEVMTPVLGKNNELLTEVKKLKAAQKQLSQFEGIDPEVARKAIEEMQRIEEEKAKAAGNFEAMKQDLITKHNQAVEKERKSAERFKSALEKHLVDSAAIQAIAKAKGVPRILLPHVKGNLRMVEEEGEFRAVVVDSRGNVRLGNANGEPMTIEQLVEEMKSDPDFGRAFEASGASGGGAPAGGANGSGGKQQSGGRGAFVLTREQAKDFAQYTKVKAEAEKAGQTVQIVSQ